VGDNSVEPDAVTGARERPKASNVRRVVVCTGQVYYKLHQLRKAKRADDVALVRLEQLSPFPHAALARRLARYPNAELVWCQEEPKNMGYWAFAQPRINTAVREILEVDRGGINRAAAFGGDDDGDDGDDRNEVWAPERAGEKKTNRRDEKTNRRDEVRRVRYVGRPAAASPATGSPVIHAAETRALVHEALGLEHVGIHLAEPRSSVPRY
jgi:2-oxoglutarate dehydrogenase E1 component